WEITIDLPAGTYEYKFTADGWSQQESLTPGSSCTVTNFGYTNRTVTVTGNTVLPVVCWGACSACSSVFPVTFKVNMANVTSSYTQVQLAGSFNGWTPASNPMTDANADGVYETTINLAPGTYEYKFAADGWAIQENLIPGSACTVTNFGYTNRSLTVGNTGQVLSTVCWGACVDCNQVQPSYNVTFKVNMSQATGFTTPELNGTFNNWCGNCTQMSDANNDGIWEVTVSLQAGTYEYKFAHDNWAGSEQLAEGSSCTVTNNGYTNRVITVTENTTLNPVCYGSCTACAPIVVEEYGCTDINAVNYNSNATIDDNSCLYSTIFNVDMTCADAFTEVYITGPWCGWCAADTYNHLLDTDGDGIYTVELFLAAGNIEYKYMVDNWASQENLVDDMQNGATCAPVTDYTNYANRLVAAGTVQNDVYGKCDACGVLPQTYNITFRVDMNQQTGFTLPEVNGTFNSWCGNCTPMSDSNGDNIWETTVTLNPGNYEYKYSFDAWAGQENLLPGSSCTVTNFGFTNRSLVVSQDSVLDVVCFGSCTSCENTPASYMVTFQVNMNQESGFTTPELNGTFNNWCGNCAQMSDGNGDNIWDITVELQEGNYEFKYSHDNWAGSENLTPGDLCTYTNGQFTNRYITIANDTIIPVVCYGSCSDCQAPAAFPVIFNIDVNDPTVTAVELTGDFNGFCAGCESMTNVSGTTWSDTLYLQAGVYNYHFTQSNGTLAETLTDMTCTVFNGTTYERTITVTSDTEAPVVCWNTCAECVVNTQEYNANGIQLYPNPSHGLVSFNGLTGSNYQVTCYDMVGHLVSTFNVSAENKNVDLTELENGMYIIRIEGGHESQQFSVVLCD
ncbi:MAG: T9SS type A sorting domain-containing protein, partial [Bacteroidetes bacterium]|nr:T9SS type A sorting domain-containing protein [Bacteroidota bacterium]